ncbi:MAG: ABC transporter permease [Clostridiales bacterium]|nr:ABC transporter permease [Clostridiales bacterium]
MNRIVAVMKKQLKDTLKNMMTLVPFLLFPVIALIFTELVAKPSPDLPDTFFVSIFASMYTGYVPLVNMAAIISEEREKKSLRMLIMSNVKPFEYLIGVGGYVLLLCAAAGVVFGLIGAHSGTDLLRFVLVMVVGALASILLGSAVGVSSKNQGAAHALAMPFAIVAGFVPMIAMFNDTFARIANVLYTQQISIMVSDISASNAAFCRFAVIGANMLIFLMVFIFAYRKADLQD